MGKTENTHTDYRGLESVPAAVVRCTGRTVYYANTRACRLFGQKKSFPLPLTGFFDEASVRTIRRVLRAKNSSDGTVLHRNGKVYDVRAGAAAANDASRTVCFTEVTGVFGSLEREKDAAKAFQTMVEHSEDGISIVYKDRFMFVNKKYLDIFGYDDEADLVGKPITKVVAPEDRKRVLANSASRQEGGNTPLIYDYLGIKRDGSSIEVEVAASRIEYNGKSASLGFHRDVTERNLLERQLVESEEFRESVFSSVDQGIAVFNESLHTLDWNNQMWYFTGIDRKDAIGKHAFDVFRKFRDGGVHEKLKDVLNGIKVSFGYLQYTHPLTQQTRFAWLNLSPLLNRGGQVRGVVGVLADHTHQKFMQDEVKESETLFRNVLEAMGDALVLTDLQGRVLRVNKEFERITGYSEEAAMGQTFPYSWFHEPDTARFVLWISELREKSYLHDFDIRWESKNGKIISVSLNTTLLKNKEGDPVAMLNIARDISDRKKLQTELQNRTRQIELINRVISKANETIEINELLITLDRELRNLLDFDRFGIVLLRNDDIEEMAFTADGDTGPSTQEKKTGRYASLGHEIRRWGSAFTSNTLRHESPEINNLPIVQAGYNSLVTVPVYSKHTFLGVLYLANREENRFIGNEIDLLQPVCEQIGLIVEKLDLFTRVRGDALYIHNLLNSIDDIVFTVDSELVITESNTPADAFPFIDRRHAKMRGNSLIGQPLYKVIAKAPYREGIDRIIDAIFSQHMPIYLSEFTFTVNGDEKSFQLRINPMKIEDRIVSLVFTHTDISELKKTEEELKRRNRDLIELNEISALLTKSIDLQEVYRLSLAKVKNMLGASFINVYLIKDDTVYLSGYAGDFTDAELASIQRIDLRASVMGEIFATKQPVIIHDNLVEYPNISAPWRKLIEKYGLQAGVNLPLIIQEKVLGTFNINFNVPRELSDQEIHFLTLITNHLSSAIENIRLYEDLHARVNDLTILASLGTIYASTLDLQEITENVLDRIVTLRHPDVLMLSLFDASNDALRVVAARGIREDVPAFPLETIHPAVRTCIDNREDLIIKDIGSEYPDMRDTLFRSDQNSIGFFTLQTEGRVLGLLSVSFTQRNQFLLEDVALYKSIATQLSMAIQNAQLYHQIQDSEEKYRQLVETAQDMVVSMDLDGTFTYVSPSSEHLTGYSPRELLSYRLSPRMIHPSDFHYISKFMRLAAEQKIAAEQSRAIEFRIRTRSGAYRWMSASWTLVHGARGNITGVQCILRDVHERRLAEEEITQQLHHQRVLYELAHDLAATLDQNEILQAVSNSINRILPFRELLVHLYDESVPDEMLQIKKAGGAGGGDLSDEPISISLADPAYELERRVVQDRRLHELKKAGQNGWRIGAPMIMKEQVLGVLIIETGKEKEFSEVHRNLLQTVTHLAGLAIEKSLLYRETVDKSLEIERRNRELDDFTYVVSHDLKEPLISIEGYSKILLSDYRETLRDEGQELLSSITQSCSRMKQLINELLALSRVGRTTESMVPVGIRDVLTEIIEDLEYTIARRNVKFNIPADLPTVLGNRVHLVVLFRNLLVNAIKFNESERPEIAIDWCDDDAMYRFSVSDNGIGIEKDYFDRIFIIFHKIRSGISYEGTGAGLTIVKKIIETHGGKIWLDSVVGRGSTFHFTLPKVKR
jgi:PAS domain S-box-containing protein